MDVYVDVIATLNYVPYTITTNYVNSVPTVSGQVPSFDDQSIQLTNPLNGNITTTNPNNAADDIYIGNGNVVTQSGNNTSGNTATVVISYQYHHYTYAQGGYYIGDQAPAPTFQTVNVPPAEARWDYGAGVGSTDSSVTLPPFKYASDLWVNLGPVDDNAAKIAALQAQIENDQSQIAALRADNSNLASQINQDKSTLNNAIAGLRDARIAVWLGALKDTLKGVPVAPGSSIVGDIVDFVATAYANGDANVTDTVNFIRDTLTDGLISYGEQNVETVGARAVRYAKYIGYANSAVIVYEDIFKGDAAQLADSFKQTISETEADLADLNSQLTDNQGQISNLRDDISAAQSQISDLQAGEDPSPSSLGPSKVLSNGPNQARPFVFMQGSDQNLADFKVSGVGHDIIQLPSSDFATIADVLRHTTDSENGAIVTDPTSGGTLQIAGVTKKELIAHQQDFALSC